MRADESRYATGVRSGKPLAALVLERFRAGVGYRPRQGIDLRKIARSPGREPLTDHPLQCVRLVHPGSEDCNRSAPLRDDKPFTRSDATQVPTEVLPKLTDTDAIRHGKM